MTQRLRIGIIIGSVRENRVGEKVARWIEEVARQREAFEVTLLDLKDYPLPLYAEPRAAKVAEHQYKLEVQRKWVAAIEALDGFIFVTPEYNHGYPAALKNALDHVYTGWNAKPVAFVSYGGVSGGTRAVQQLRQVVVELQMVAVHDEVPLPFVMRLLGPDGRPTDPAYTAKANSMLDQLHWWAETLTSARARRPLPGTSAAAIPPPAAPTK